VSSEQMATNIKSGSIVLYSSLYSLPLRSLRPLRLNHSDATGNDIKEVNKRNLQKIPSLFRGWEC